MKYTFRCEKHGDFEVNQSISETENTHTCKDEKCKLECTKVLQVSYFKCEKATKTEFY